MKYLFLIILIIFCFSCIVTEGYVFQKYKEEYKEWTEIKTYDIQRKEIQYRYDFWEGEYGYYPTDVHDYYLYKEYLIKDGEDFILIVKNKKNKNTTKWYVEKYVYDKLGIEHTYDQDIYYGSLTDYNNEYILLEEWREE